MSAQREMSKVQFRAALKQNGFRQVLLWAEDVSGATRASYGLVMWPNGKMAYRASLAHVIRARKAAIAKAEAKS